MRLEMPHPLFRDKNEFPEDMNSDNFLAVSKRCKHFDKQNGKFLYYSHALLCDFAIHVWSIRFRTVLLQVSFQ